ncbi:hypothetical protein FD723_22065 [Nostoc sp. C052]|uniref:hypothetical protein n=1 Tax=Nostoc sp. C052 TaxID=2576902 RepID=UPI0015C2CD6F|nr:hypothetical protein [Nostoc sp. C052]QLE42861.1 hypothetical protein FD723_22065 [Nostoc sp. C052]
MSALNLGRVAILVGFWGKGERGKKKPLPFNLYPKPNSELKIFNRAVLGQVGTPIPQDGLSRSQSRAGNEVLSFHE